MALPVLPLSPSEAVAGRARLALIGRLGLRGRLHDPDLDAIVATLAAACRVPAAAISIVTPDLQTYPAEVGLGVACSRVPDHLSFCADVVTSAAPLQVADSRLHPTYSANPLVVAGSVRAYAGEPLVHEGLVIGTVSVFDSEVREFSGRELTVLRAQARLASAVIGLRSSATWDRLTGLALRPLLLERTRQAMAARRPLSGHDGHVALLVLDVLGMTAINEAFGFDSGDRLLMTLGDRLRTACAPHESAARIGGDEFAVLLPDVASAAAARSRCEALIEAVSAPPVDGGVGIALRSGLAVTPSTAADALLASAERSAVRRRRVYRARLIDATESAMCAVAGDGTIREVNGPWRSFAASNGGDPAACSVGVNYLDVCDRATGPNSSGAAAVAEGLRRVLSGSLRRFEVDYTCHAPNQKRWFSLRIVQQPYGAGAVLSHHDITGTKTGAPASLGSPGLEGLGDVSDLTVLGEHVDLAVAEAARRHHLVALAVMAVDHLEQVTAASEIGALDALLEEVRRRLSSRIRSSDSLVRTAQNQFVVVWRELGSAEQAQHLAAHLRMAFDAPFVVEATEVLLSASIGLSILDRRQTGDEMVEGAVSAMQEATGRGPGQLRVFTPALPVEPRARIRTEAQLLQGIQREEFELHYQPVVDLVSGTVVGVEALVRWQHPTDGLLGPDLFIPLAEATGSIVALGRWVLEQACAQAASWHGEGLALTMAVNLSTLQVGHPDLVETVSQTLRITGLDAHNLGFEVTESAVMEDAEAAVVVLNALTALGTSLSIDDFGTGYSSLIYLKRYPIRALKIDRAFVSGMGANEEDDAIVASVIALARAVGGTCVAEGIETAEQFAALRALGCRYGQGWLFGKGVPAAELPELIGRCERDLAVRLVDMPPPGDQRDLAGDRRDQAAGDRDQAADVRDDIGDARDHVGDERDLVGDQRDLAGDQRDTAADERDQLGTRRDLAADVRDQAGEQRDEVGARRDEAGDQRDRAADRRDVVGARRDEAGDQRDQAADRRDQVGTSRDRAGDVRDQAADERDQMAEQRDQAAEQRDSAADARDQAAERSEQAGGIAVARQEAALDRNRASQDRKAGASERTQAERDRTTALADRDAGASERIQAETDRCTALADRGAGATERNSAEHDRGTALADRGAGATERGQAERDRDTALADRGAGATERGQAEHDRDTALADRGAGATERGHAEHDRDTALADRGAGAVERNRAEQDRGTALADRGAAADDRAHASVDALTGVYARGAGLLELSREVGRAHRSDGPMTVAFVDVDGLKAANDEHGHSIGDDILRAVAGTLTDQLRFHDLVFRYGGDEFICALHDMSLDDVVQRFVAVNRLLAELPMRPSVSVGYAVLQPGEGAEQLVGRADRDLYRIREGARAAG
ncbi:MAG: hypothetical protein NVSMB55_09020 [Mycobacteriales bacterium]